MANELNNQKETIKFELYLPEKEEILISDLQKQIWNDELEALNPLTHGEVAINGLYIFEGEENYELSVFIRNGLERSILINTVPMRIIDEENNVLAQAFVEFTDAGQIPSLKARPFKVYLDKESVLDKNICDKKWKVVYTNDAQITETVEVKEYEDIPAEADTTIREQLKEYLDTLPAVPYGNVTVNIFRLSHLALNKIDVVVVIRNGADMDVELGKLPITLVHEEEELVASGIFDLSSIRISKDKAKVCNLSFENDDIVKKDIDIRRCSVKLG